MVSLRNSRSVLSDITTGTIQDGGCSVSVGPKVKKINKNKNNGAEATAGLKWTNSVSKEKVVSYPNQLRFGSCLSLQLGVSYPD